MSTTCRGGDRVYSTRISSDFTVDAKGDVRLHELNAKVNGACDNSYQKRAVACYNSDLEMPEYWYEVPEWYSIYRKMFRNMLKWKKRVYKK
jgi:hypothetical protein